VNQPIVRAAALAALAAAAYAGSIHGGFVFDDVRAVVDNPVVTGREPLAHAFTRDFWGLPPGLPGPIYRPLVVLGFALQWRLGGGTGWIFHAFNVLLHAACVAALYLVWRRIAEERAALAGAVFAAVFAAPAEAVQAVVGQADLLAGLLVTVALAAHRTPGVRGAAAATCCFAAALGCKEIAATAPFAFFALDLITPSPARPRGRFIAYAAALAAYLPLRANALGGLLGPVDPLHNPLANGDAVGRIFGAGRVFLERYAAGFLDPGRRLYACGSPACAPSGADDPFAWAGLLLFAALLAAPILLRRRAPAAAAGLAWFAVLFFPVSNFPLTSTTVYGERLLYAPAAGLAIAFGAAVAALPRPWLATALFAAVALPNAALLQARHRDWRDEDRLFFSALSAAPDAALVQANAAAACYRGRDPVCAEAHARRALELWPGLAAAESVLASSLDRQGRAAEAEAIYARLMSAGPNAGVVADYALFLARRGRAAEALQAIRAFRGAPTARLREVEALVTATPRAPP
jgi:tetratricopeptide (TPR) repeat protein